MIGQESVYGKSLLTGVYEVLVLILLSDQQLHFLEYLRDWDPAECHSGTKVIY